MSAKETTSCYIQLVTAKEGFMSKGQDAKKNVKRKPEKTLKEKRKEKKAKRDKA
jgi:hypothetical protein